MATAYQFDRQSAIISPQITGDYTTTGGKAPPGKDSKLRCKAVDFRELITRNFTRGSGIRVETFQKIADWIADTEVDPYSHEVSYPLDEALNRKTPQWGQYWQPRQARPSIEAFAFRNWDGTLWQVIEPDHKDPRGYRYLAPTGGGNRLYFPPIVDWGKVRGDATIPIVLTEGGKKAIVGADNGYATIAGYGCNCLSGREGLNPDLLPYAVPGRVFIIALDKDTKLKTRRRVGDATQKLARSLADRGCIVKFADWDAHTGKGLDDLFVAVGHEGLCRILDGARLYWGNSATPIPANLYHRADRLAHWGQAFKSHRFVLDTSAPGTGKSHDAGQIGFEKAIYISNDRRNATTPTLETWPNLESRHGGLTRDQGKTRRAKPGDSIMTPGNCRRDEAHNQAREMGIDGDEICSTCPLLNACRNSRGEGWGFKFERKEVLQYSRFRAHPASLPPSEDFDYSGYYLTFEEVGTIAFTQQITAARDDLSNLIVELGDRIPALIPYLRQLRELFTDKTERWGRGADKLPPLPPLTTGDLQILRDILAPDFSALNTEDCIDDAEFAKVRGHDKHRLAKANRALKRETRLNRFEVARSVSSMPNQWLLWLIEGATPYLNNGVLTLIRADERLRKIIQAAKGVLFLDATMTPQLLSSLAGLEASEIYHCGAQSPTTKLEVIQVDDLGRLGMQRGAFQERRVEAIVSHIRADDPTTKVIDFKKFDQDGAWWRDSRGSNDFQNCNTLLLVGTPSRNLEAVRAEYIALGNDPDQFPAYYNELIRVDMLQGIGRIRANCRPDENLRVVILSNFPISPSIKTIRSGVITPSASSKAEQTIRKCAEAAKNLLDRGGKLTQTAIAKITGLARETVNRIWDSVTFCLDRLISKMSHPDPPFNSPQDAPAAAEIVQAVLIDNDTTFNDIAEVFGYIDRKLWPLVRDFLTDQDLKTLVDRMALATG